MGVDRQLRRRRAASEQRADVSSWGRWKSEDPSEINHPGIAISPESSAIYTNRRFFVQERTVSHPEWGHVTQLRVVRFDGAIASRQDMLRIKQELLDADRVAIIVLSEVNAPLVPMDQITGLDMYVLPRDVGIGLGYVKCIL